MGNGVRGEECADDNAVSDTVTPRMGTTTETEPAIPSIPTLLLSRLPAGRHTWPFSFRVPPVPSLPQPTRQSRSSPLRSHWHPRTTRIEAQSLSMNDEELGIPIDGCLVIGIGPSEVGVKRRRREGNPGSVAVERGWTMCGSVEGEVNASLPRSASRLVDVAIEERCTCTYPTAALGPLTPTRPIRIFRKLPPPTPPHAPSVSPSVLEPSTAQPLKPTNPNLAMNMAAPSRPLCSIIFHPNTANDHGSERSSRQSLHCVAFCCSVCSEPRRGSGVGRVELMAIVDEADREAARRGVSIDTLPVYWRLGDDGGCFREEELWRRRERMRRKRRMGACDEFEKWGDGSGGGLMLELFVRAGGVGEGGDVTCAECESSSSSRVLARAVERERRVRAGSEEGSGVALLMDWVEMNGGDVEPAAESTVEPVEEGVVIVRPLYEGGGVGRVEDALSTEGCETVVASPLRGREEPEHVDEIAPAAEGDDVDLLLFRVWEKRLYLLLRRLGRCERWRRGMEGRMIRLSVGDVSTFGGDPSTVATSSARPHQPCVDITATLATPTLASSSSARDDEAPVSNMMVGSWDWDWVVAMDGKELNWGEEETVGGAWRGLGVGFGGGGGGRGGEGAGSGEFGGQ
ncbi:hypothetical protein BC829DRAFT_443915 [Chytridium lagenaria]|nr:hypothetical protein BC829DRAFT_443915 [Chytridium lagenaria]